MMNQNRLTRTLTATARRLYEKGDEVLVIDIDSNRINMVPTATYVLKDSDILIVLGSQASRKCGGARPDGHLRAAGTSRPGGFVYNRPPCLKTTPLPFRSTAL
jgi:hypothetical protein